MREGRGGGGLKEGGEEGGRGAFRVDNLKDYDRRTVLGCGLKNCTENAMPIG